MNKELAAIIPFLDPKCHLSAEVQVSDHQAIHGIPMEYIARDMGSIMGNYISAKLPLIMQRNFPSMGYGYGSPQCGVTTYRAEVYVFTEAELLKLVERVQNVEFNKISSEVEIKIKKVKTELKEKVYKALA